MPKNYTYYRATYQPPRKRYGLGHWISDSVLTVLTCGLWLIKISVREKRNN